MALPALVLVPPKSRQVGAATVTARISAGPGRTDLLIPPLGRVQANTHTSPLSLTLSLQEVDVQRLSRSITPATDGGDLRDELQSGLRDLAIQVALRSIVGAFIFGGIAAALLPHRRWLTITTGAVSAAVVVAGLVAMTGASYQMQAFEQPRFTGALTRAPVVIQALNEKELSLSEVESRFAVGASRLEGLLEVLAEPTVDPGDGSVAILHISDIHSNPIGLEITRQLAERFEVDAIVDTGDLTNFGIHLETEFAGLVRGMPAPYYYVSGNHDSVSVQAAMERLPNVTVLHGRTAEIRGIRVFGWPDPTYTNWNLLPPGEAAQLRTAEGAQLAQELRTADPDVLLVHDRRTAGEAFGLVPLILSGHYHRAIVEERAGTRLLAVGSTGAAGLQSFTTEADMAYEAQVLYLRGGAAVAYDYVTFSGLGGDFEIKRRNLEPLGPLMPASPTPSATP